MVKKKDFYHYQSMIEFEIFKEQLLRKEKFYSSWTCKKNSDRENEHVLKVWNNLEMKRQKDYHKFCLKCDALLLADVFKKFKK